MPLQSVLTILQTDNVWANKFQFSKYNHSYTYCSVPRDNILQYHSASWLYIIQYIVNTSLEAF